MSYQPSASAEVIGAGTNYTLTTGASARVDFGTTDPEVVLPAAGIYLVYSQILYIADSLGATDVVQVQLRNSTDSVFIGAPANIDAALAAAFESTFQSSRVVITASKTIQIWAYNTSSARGTIISVATLIGYTRIG